MPQITEIGRVNGTAYGVVFVVCRNGEVARLGLDLEDEDEALRLMNEAARAISDAGFDYDYCTDFRAYNGGPRLGLVDPIYFVADVIETEGEPDELDLWKRTWQRGAGKTDIPAEIAAKVEAAIEAATKAMK